VRLPQYKDNKGAQINTPNHSCLMASIKTKEEVGRECAVARCFQHQWSIPAEERGSQEAISNDRAAAQDAKVKRMTSGTS
jgi:hypothetical protein